MQILEELWYGQIRPISQTDYRDKEYRELIDLLAHIEERLLPTLDQEQQENLQKAKDLWEEMNQISECAAFISGFRLAVRLMAASV